MKTIVYYLLSILFVFFANCKNANKQKQEKLTILRQIDVLEIQYTDARTGEISDFYGYSNDTVFYQQTNLYIKGKKYQFVNTEKAEDSVIDLYHLKKVKFDYKKTYQHHFEYEDCILKQKVKMDSGAVHTFQSKNGAVFQVVDIMEKPIWLQVCYKGKTYKERIQLVTDNIHNKLLGNGYSNVMFYDVDKDGKDELLLIREKYDEVFADVYKINLPK